MTRRRRADGRLHPTDVAPTAGLFGLLGQGNLGNDGSLEAVLAYLRAKHPDVILDVLCTGPDLVSEQYNIPAAHLRWHHSARRSASGLIAFARRTTDLALGMTIDSFRLASWVRRHDAVIVPGMGVLETTVPMRTWKTPYWMFLLCASGRLFGTKVALVSTGANFIDERSIRMLITAAARLAYYRSFRDAFSRDSMQQMGLDTSCDAVYPDVVFSLPTPQDGTGHPKKRWHRRHGLLREKRRPTAGGRYSLLVHREDDQLRSMACRQWPPDTIDHERPPCRRQDHPGNCRLLASTPPRARSVAGYRRTNRLYRGTHAANRHWSTPWSPLAITTSYAP